MANGAFVVITACQVAGGEGDNMKGNNNNI